MLYVLKNKSLFIKKIIFFIEVIMVYEKIYMYKSVDKKSNS